jgi:hypothetical protein
MDLGDARVDDAEERAVAALGAPGIVEAGLGKVVLAVVAGIVRGGTKVRADVIVVDGGDGGLTLELLLDGLESLLGGGLGTFSLGLRDLDYFQVCLLEVIPHSDIGRARHGVLGHLPGGVLVGNDEPVGDVGTGPRLVVDVGTSRFLGLAACGGR